MRILKNSKVNTLLIGLMMMAFILCFSGQAQAAQEGDFTYTVSEAAYAAEITHYTGAGGYVAIPMTLSGYPVTSIGVRAFQNCTSLTSISIPQGVKSIGSYAFENCTSLTSISIPQGVTSISGYAFKNCTSLTSISIPQGVTSIGISAFLSCTSLTYISIPQTVTFIDRDAFQYCTSLTSINLPEGLTIIGSGIFKNCTSLTSISIPQGVTSIGGSSFQNCTSLTSISIPQGVTRIFSGAFLGCSGLTTISLPEGLTSIGNSAFLSCTSLTYISIPQTVTFIESGTFQYCSSLTSINLPEGLISIGGSAFWKTSLTSISIPQTVTSIGSGAFQDCLKLTSVSLPQGITNIDNYTFQNCTSLTTISIPQTVSTIGIQAFSNCPKINGIILPEGLTSIADGAFQYCTSLTSIIIPQGVTSIGGFAFRECSGLTSISIPEGVTSIGNTTFYGCSNLTTISIPQTVSTIGIQAFSNCPKINGIILSEGLTSIANASFQHCTNLTSISIPQGVTSVGWGAFQGDAKLQSITFNSATTSIYDAADTISTQTKIIGFDPSTAKDYATKYNRTFQVIAVTKTLTSIAITNPATKLIYDVGEPLDISGLEVTGTYSDDSTRVEPIAATNMTGFNSSSPAVEQVLTISIGDKTTTYTVQIIATNGEFTYIVIAGEAQITGYNGAGGGVLIPDIIDGYTVTSIGDNAFLNGSSITSIGIPQGITSIGKYAFRGCTGLTSISIPTGVTIIDEGVFYGCSGLISVSIPEGVIAIGGYAFYGCSNLATIIIPQTVTSIGEYAFYGCSHLDAVSIPPTVTSIGPSAFYNCPAITNIIIPEETTIIPEETTIISDNAYLNWSGLTSIIIPEGVLSIGQRSFDGCYALDTITFMSATTSIYDAADTISTQATIRGYVPSTAKDYATKYNREFEDIGTYTLISIAVTNPATKLIYNVGEPLDISGLEVIGTYNNGSIQVETITTANVTGFNSSSPAVDQVLTITVGGKTTTYTVTIVDTTAPVINIPADIVTEATAILTPVNIGEASATDDSQIVSLLNNAPAVGYPIGTTIVTWTATDANGNVSTADQNVTIVDTTAPVFTFVPADITAEATAENTPVAIGEATATDLFVVSITNDAPTAFPLGTTVVTWTATDANGNQSAAIQTIVIVDTTAPVITAPDSLTVEASAVLSILNIGQATTSDASAVTITNDAPSAFPLGTTIVTWTATDAGGNQSTDAQNVTVQDTTGPTITIPGDITLEATAVSTLVDIGTATAIDIFSPVEITNNATQEGFSVGTTTVTWTATDSNGNVSTSVQNVTVVDSTVPVFTIVPADVTVFLTGSATPVDIGSVTATDIFPVAVTNNAPNAFMLGKTIVTWTATDINGNTSIATQKVTVQYAYSGILQPIESDGSSIFKLGRTIPVKFELKDASGNYISDATATLTYAKITNSVLGTELETESTAAATTGNLFRVNSNQYIFNMSTETLSIGTYELSINLDDGNVYKVNVSMK